MRGGGEEQIIVGKKTNEMQPASALTILVIMRRGGGRSRSSSSTTCASAASSSTVAAVVVVVSAYSEAPSSSPSARSSAAGIASTVVSSFVISLSLSLVGYYLRCQILHLSRKCHRQPDKIFGAVKTTSVDTSTIHCPRDPFRVWYLVGMYHTYRKKPTAFHNIMVYRGLPMFVWRRTRDW